MSDTPAADAPPAVRLGDLFLPIFLKLASVQPGERVLDLSVRGGEAGYEAARRSGTQGEYLALDTDPSRLEAFISRAHADGMDWTRGEVNDASKLPSPDSYWDVVLCHLGLPLLPNPEATLRETGRVLRPVGRTAISCFGQRERCPLVTIFLDAVAQHVPAAKELDRALFRYSAVGALANTLGELGFEDAVPDRHTEWPFFAGVDEYWAAMAADSRFASLVQGMTGEQIDAAKQEITRKTRFYRRGSGMELKCEGIVLAIVK